MMVVNLAHAEGHADDFLVPQENQLRALAQHIGQHQQLHVVAALLLHRLHGGEQLGQAGEHALDVQAGNLPDAQVVPGNVEFLEVGGQQLVHALVGAGAQGEDLPAQFVQVDACNPRQALGDAPVVGRAGGGFEQHRVRQYGRGHEPG